MTNRKDSYTISTLKDALGATLIALEEANSHILNDLQPAFQCLAEGCDLPEIVCAGQASELLRLGTWWHGVGTEDTIKKARAVLNDHED